MNVSTGSLARFWLLIEECDLSATLGHLGDLLLLSLIPSLDRANRMTDNILSKVNSWSQERIREAVLVFEAAVESKIAVNYRWL